MPTLTLAQKNDKVLEIDATVEQKLGKAWKVIKRALARVDPDRLLVFSQAHEIEHLEARNLALGFILSHVEEAQKGALREFARLQSRGVDVDRSVVETVRSCLVEQPVEKEGGNGR